MRRTLVATAAKRLGLTIALALACIVASAQPAAAVEVVPLNFAWGVVDETGVDNDVVISQVSPDKIRVTDTAGVTFVGGCAAEGPQAAVCDIQLPLVADSFFNMGGGNDSL